MLEGLVLRQAGKTAWTVARSHMHNARWFLFSALYSPSSDRRLLLLSNTFFGSHRWLFIMITYHIGVEKARTYGATHNRVINIWMRERDGEYIRIIEKYLHCWAVRSLFVGEFLFIVIVRHPREREQLTYESGVSSTDRTPLQTINECSHILNLKT